ncbi:MAG: CDP-diacylglycerol--serine O-phosphatidyltransferase [Candidatus Zixiibacteriota bacterium]
MHNYKGIFPGVFTMGNVVCGFLSILSALEGHVTAACWFVVLAGVADVLDGKAARIAGATSQFGVELDSLADFLSFGAAPAVLVYSVRLNALGKLGLIISIMYIMAAAYRLARYNIMADSEEKRDFVGMPVPLAAFGLVSYIIFSYNLWGELRYEDVLVTMIAVFSFVMVSQIQYDTWPETFSTRWERIKALALVVAVIGLVIRPRLLLFPMVAAYILFGLAREAYRLFYVGVGKVTGRPYGRRKTDRKIIDESE